MMKTILPILSVLLLGACSGSGEFSGQSASSELAREEKTQEEEPDDSGGKKDKKSQLGKVGDSEVDDNENAIPNNEKPSNVPTTTIVKGSFTAWAEPSNPMPRQDYWIHVEVKLPSNVSNYMQTDLSGRLTGTDGYTRGIGRDSQRVEGNAPPWAKLIKPDDRFEMLTGRAKVSIFVPGAAHLVRDTIQIRSDLLNESQSLEIVFR